MPGVNVIYTSDYSGGNYLRLVHLIRPCGGKPSQLSADLPVWPSFTKANASGPDFDPLSIYWQDEHGHRNGN